MAVLFVVAGLGNPGDRYDRTRHNVGAEVVKFLARAEDHSLVYRKSCNYLGTELKMDGVNVLLAFPQSFMNESGRPLSCILRRNPGVELTSLVVVHDELDLPLGSVRVKRGGGLAGHNGLKSVACHVGSNDFIRVRIGIDRPRPGGDVSAWVLSRPSAKERDILDAAIENGAEAIRSIVRFGVDQTMNIFNVTTK